MYLLKKGSKRAKKGPKKGQNGPKWVKKEVQKWGQKVSKISNFYDAGFPKSYYLAF